MNRTRQILGANLSSLMNSSSELASAPAVERATAQKGLKVGRSTVQRVKDGDTTVNLDYIEVFAKVFHKEPWQLLHPAIGEMASSTDAVPTLAQALEVVGRALLAADPAMRSSAVDLLVTYVRDPASNDDLIPAIAKRLTAPADLQRRADIERALTKNKEGIETRDISAKTFAGDGDEPTFAKKQ